MAFPDKGFRLLLTYDDHQSVFGSTLPSVRCDLLIRRHVSHIIHFTLLALVHGLVGLFVSPAETKASPEPSWTRTKRQKKKKKRQKKKKACVSVYIQTRVYAHLNLQLCNSIYGQFSVLANTSTAPCPIPHIVLCSLVL